MVNMKLLLGKLGASLGIIGLTLFGYAEGWGVDWKYYGTNEDGTYFYDRESMTRNPKNTVEVWVQSAYTEKSVSHWVKEGGEAFQDLDFSLILFELSCLERSTRYSRIVFYSKKGGIFYPIDNEEWHFIVPDSMTSKLHREVCK